MKNKIIIALLGAAALAAAASCTRDGERQPTPHPKPLVFSVMPLTRAANYPIEEYMDLCDSVNAWEDVWGAVYKYDNGLLKYSSGYVIVFPEGGQPTGYVVLQWPVPVFYTSDQSTKEAFLLSDRLGVIFAKIMPADVIPVEFEHFDYLITFTCGAGHRIATLTLTDGQKTYKAWCDPDLEDAQLIIRRPNNIGGMTGLLELDDGRDFTFEVGDYPTPDNNNQSVTVTINITP